MSKPEMFDALSGVDALEPEVLRSRWNRLSHFGHVSGFVKLATSQAIDPAIRYLAALTVVAINESEAFKTKYAPGMQGRRILNSNIEAVKRFANELSKNILVVQRAKQISAGHVCKAQKCPIRNVRVQLQ